MSLEGTIHLLRLTDRDGGQPHPHLTVVNCTATRCLVVPGYTPDKPAVTAIIKSLRRRGYPEHALFAEIDHAKMLTSPPSGLELHRAWYVFENSTTLDAAVIQKGKAWGPLHADGVRIIAKGLLGWNLHCGGSRLSQRAVRLLEKKLS
jgi:hypothetical protein